MTRQNFSSKGASTMGNVAQTGTTSKRVLLIYRFWSFIFSLHLNTILANCCFVFLTIFVGIGRGRSGVAQEPGGLDGALDPAGRLPARHDQRGRLRPGRWVWTLKLVPILTFPPPHWDLLRTYSTQPQGHLGRILLGGQGGWSWRWRLRLF